MTEMALPEGNAVLAQDPSGAAFVVLKGTGQTAYGSVTPNLWGWFGLGLILISAFTAHLWPWALFLSFWVIQGLRTGETYLLSRVGKNSEPVLFWLIMAVLAVLAVISAVYPLGVS